MDQNIKTKWVEALRSGDYEQTSGVLKDSTGGYCCLGVLTELYRQETGCGEWAPKPGDETRFEFAEDDTHTDGYPSDEICDWAELPRVSKDVIDVYGLATLNDDERLSFAEIADVIEKEL